MHQSQIKVETPCVETITSNCHMTVQNFETFEKLNIPNNFPNIYDFAELSFKFYVDNPVT